MGEILDVQEDRRETSTFVCVRERERERERERDGEGGAGGSGLKPNASTARSCLLSV